MKSGLRLALASTVAAVALNAAPALADGDAIADLQRQIQLLQQQVNDLQKNKADHSVEWKGAAKIKGDDRDFKVRGRLMVDWANTDGDGAGSYIDNATEARRARLGVEGKIAEKTKYKFEAEYDPTDDAVNLTDAYLQFGTSAGKLTVGQQKVPVSLEEQTSSRHTTFMERAAFTDAFGFGRRLGVTLGQSGDNWSVKGGVFGANLSKSAGDEGTAFAARGTYAPINEKDRVVHLGISASHTQHEDLSGNDYDVRPLVHQEAKYIGDSDDGVFGLGTSEEDTFYGVEAAAVMGAFSAQAEYGRQEGDFGAAGDVEFDGYYIDLSYFLTGENRKYKASKGTFDRVSPTNPVDEGGMGAWQVAARYDVIDATDLDVNGALPGSGGEQKAWVVGLNWYLNKYAKIMFNYSQAEIEDSVENLNRTGSLDNTIDAFQVRTQIDW